MLTEDSLPLIRLDNEPWSLVKSSIKPNAKLLKEEIKRRYDVDGLIAPTEEPKPKNWLVPKLTDWLVSHPIILPIEVNWILSEVNRLKSVLSQARNEQASAHPGNWRGQLPMLRLIHCLVDDDAIKHAFLRRAVVLTRTELDARNSDVREPTVWEMLSDKWNDDNFHPVTSTSTCHEDFSSPITLEYSKVEDLSSATPEKVENKFAEMRANLIRIIKSVESQWTRRR